MEIQNNKTVLHVHRYQVSSRNLTVVVYFRKVSFATEVRLATTTCYGLQNYVLTRSDRMFRYSECSPSPGLRLSQKNPFFPKLIKPRSGRNVFLLSNIFNSHCLNVKGKGILFNVGGQTGKDCLLTLADGVKVADCRDRTSNLSLRKRCHLPLHHGTPPN